MHQRHRCAPRWDTFMGRGTLHSPNQPSNHCTVRAQRRFERHGIKVEIMLVRSGDAKEAARGDVFMMKQMLLGARLPKGSGSTQARVRTSAPEGAGSNQIVLITVLFPLVAWPATQEPVFDECGGNGHTSRAASLCNVHMVSHPNHCHRLHAHAHAADSTAD